MTCPVLKPSDYVSSSVTHRLYEVTNNDVLYCSCSSSNLIYLITCSRCSLQYVGETAQQLRKRMNKHRNDIAKGHGSCPHLIKHFNSGPCQGATYTLRVLEKRPGTGRTDRDVIDKNEVADRKESETKWMLKLRTVYPYGLNHDTGKNFDRGDNVVGKDFPKLASTVKQTNHRYARNNRNNYTPFKIDSFINNIKNEVGNNIHNVANILRISVGSLKKGHMKALVERLRDELETQNMEQWYRMAIDIVETRLYRPPAVKARRKPPKYRLNLIFMSKAFDFINLPKILRNDACLEVKPVQLDEDDIPMVVFSLEDPIRSTILNYTKFVSSLDLSAASANLNSIPCCCSQFDPKYTDNHHKHILTGDLSIIDNLKLRQLISKGPKYREPAKVDFVVARSFIDDELDQYIEAVAADKKLDKEVFGVWKTAVLDAVDERIRVVKERFVEKDVHPVLQDPDVKRCLKSLHRKFVFTPIDKAANNIAVICQRLYVSVILKELDFENIDNTNNNNTYERANIPHDDIVKTHQEYQSNLQLDLEKDMRKLPPMHWTPKMHKTPVGARFIIG